MNQQAPPVDGRPERRTPTCRVAPPMCIAELRVGVARRPSTGRTCWFIGNRATSRTVLQLSAASRRARSGSHAPCGGAVLECAVEAAEGSRRPGAWPVISKRLDHGLAVVRMSPRPVRSVETSLLVGFERQEPPAAFSSASNARGRPWASRTLWEKSSSFLLVYS